MSTSIGVVGAGTMGTGVSLAFAQAGHEVVLVDCDPVALDKARERIAQDAYFARLVTDPAARSPQAVLDMVTTTVELADLRGLDYVIENITESWPAKRQLYPALDEVCGPECILAVNTSAIPVTRLAGLTGRPERVIGNHFMNPAHLMPMVEVIRGVHTAEATVSASQAMLAGIGKRSVVVNDSPGFVTNRVLMLTLNEAAFLLHEGVASAADIDLLFRTCFGHRMGPLETADLIGLDTVLYSLEVLLDNYNDPKYRPCPLLRRYVDAGHLGRKSGRGFHRYDELIEHGAKERI